MQYLKLFLDVIQFLQNLIEQLLRIENIYYVHFFGFIVAFFYPVWRINALCHVYIYLMTLVIH